MAARTPLVSGNWKMHLNHFEAIQLVQKLSYLLTKDDYAAVNVSVHPPFTDLRSVQTLVEADDIFVADAWENASNATAGRMIFTRLKEETEREELQVARG